MTGPTGADQPPRGGDLDQALDEQRELYAEQAARARVARQVTEILDEHHDPPPPPGR